jgi:hypothetical protein
MGEQDNNTTGKRIRKFNMQRPVPNGGQGGYDDESGTEVIDDNQLKEIKKLNKQAQQINNVTANFGELKISK